MVKFKRYIRISIVLGVLSAAGLVFSHLALTDIYHGGEPLAAEWTVVLFTFFMVFAYVAYSTYILLKILQRLNNPAAGG